MTFTERRQATGLAPRPLLPTLLIRILCILLVLREVGLLLPHISVQTLRQALEPVAHRVADTDGGKWVARGRDANAAAERR